MTLAPWRLCCQQTQLRTLVPLASASPLCHPHLQKVSDRSHTALLLIFGLDPPPGPACVGLFMVSSCRDTLRLLGCDCSGCCLETLPPAQQLPQAQQPRQTPLLLASPPPPPSPTPQPPPPPRLRALPHQLPQRPALGLGPALPTSFSWEAPPLGRSAGGRSTGAHGRGRGAASSAGRCDAYSYTEVWGMHSKEGCERKCAAESACRAFEYANIGKYVRCALFDTEAPNA